VLLLDPVAGVSTYFNKGLHSLLAGLPSERVKITIRGNK